MDVQKYSGKFTGRAAGSVLLTLAAALALWLFIAANHRKAAIEDISKSLETINSYKTAEISAWLDDHKREALRLSRHPFLGEIISAERAKPGSKRAVLSAWLKDHTEQKQYASMAFLSPRGTIIAATPGYLVETKKEFTGPLGLALKNGAPQVTDIYLATSGRPRIAMFSPISAGDSGGKPVCVLAIKINLENRFYPILKAAPLFFTEAETLLVRKEGENALFLNPLNHVKDSALKFTRPLTEERLPAAAALRGVTGFFQGVDYRGVRVFSSIGTVPGTNWAVITKVDRDTVIAPAKSKEQLYLAMILLGAGLLYFLVYAVIRARRHAAEADLERSRHLLAETEKIGKVGGWEFNIDTRKQVWTEEVYRIHELDPAYEPDFEKGLNFYIPDSRPVFERAVENTTKTGEGFDLELEIVTAKGNKRAVHAIGKADLANRRIYGFFQDITERRQAESERQKIERIFNEFMEHSPVYVFFKDKDLRALHLSRNYEAMLGRPLKELLGKSMDELFPSDLAKSMIEDDKRIIREGKEVVVDEEFNGRYYRTIKFPIKIEGAPSYLAGYTLDITETKLAEEALRKSEAEQKAVLENLLVGVVTHSPDTGIISSNHEAQRILGLTEAQLLGRKAADPEWDFVDEDLTRLAPAAYPVNRVLSSGAPFSDMVLGVRRPDRNHIIWVNVGGIPIFSTDGALQRVIVNFLDITPRRKAEEELRHSLYLLDTAGELSKIGGWELDVPAMKLTWSAETRRIHEVAPGFEPDLQTAINFYAPEDQPRIGAAVKAGLEEGKPFDLDLSVITAKGNRIAVHALGRAETRAGRTVRLWGTFQDITERKLAEEKLRESEERQRITLEVTQIGTWDWNVETDTWSASPTYYTMLGYDPEQGPADRQAWLDRVHPDDKDMIASKISGVLAGTRERYQYEARIKHADGTYRWQAVLGRTVKSGEGGKAARIMGVRMDITERKLAEQKLRESEARYRALVDASGDGLLTADLETMKFRFANRAICRMLGYTAEELTNMAVTDIHPKEALPAVIAEFEAQARGEKTLAPNLPCLRKDGSVFYADITTTPVTVDGRRCNLGIFRDITERRLAEEALKKSEERYRETVELAVDGFLLGSPEGKIIGANSQMQKLTGRTLDELLGLNVSALFSPGTLEAAPLRFDLLNEGQTVINERSLLRPDGTTLPVEMHSKRMPNGTYQSIYRDITGSKLAEKERLSHLHFLESLDRVNRAIQGAEGLEKMMSGVLTAVLDIFDCDRAWLFYPCDPEATSFQVPMEITRPEYPGAKILNTDIPIPPDMARNLREALESPDPVTYTLGTEKDINKVSAEQFGVKSQMMTALYPKSGKPWAFGIHQCSYSRAWTPEEMRLLQEIGRRLADSLTSLLSRSELQESEHSLREAHRLARLGNWKLDLVTNRLTWSDEIYRIFELDPGKFGASYEAFLEAIHPDDRAYVDKVYTDSVKSRSAYNIVHRLLMKDGRIKYINECCETSYAPDGRPLASQGTSLDITEMKLTELELERLNRDLVAKRQEMENFLYITSHDLRTPLVNIQGFAQNLENYLRELVEELSPARLPREVNEAVSKLIGQDIPGALKFVLESSHKMDSLINSLLKVARLGRVEMKPRDLDMNDTLKKVVDSTSYQLKEAGAAAKVGVLPPCKADPAAVSQIFANLLENAIKYRAEGRALSVSITGEAIGARVLYKVADNGSGIAGKDLGRIWDIFYRGTGAGEGEGIGLTVVKYMAEKNGGSIRAESEEGRGTVFYLELPAAGGTK